MGRLGRSNSCCCCKRSGHFPKQQHRPRLVSTLLSIVLIASLYVASVAAGSGARQHGYHDRHVIAPRLSKSMWQQRCGVEPSLQWLRDYMTWHAQQRAAVAADPQAAQQAKYLVYRCVKPKGFKPGIPYCEGLADRLRGIMWLLRLAHLTQRILLVQQDHPAPMEKFLVPNLVDWSVGSLELPDPGDDVYIDLTSCCIHAECFAPDRLTNPACQQYACAHTRRQDRLCRLAGLVWHRLPRCSSTGDEKCTVPQVYNDTSVLAEISDKQYVFTLSNYGWANEDEEDLPVKYNSQPFPDVSHPLAFHCLFHALFRASPASEQAALRSLQIMGLDVAATYTALHLRMGGLIGEQVTLHHDLKPVSFADVANMIECAREWEPSTFERILASATGAVVPRLGGGKFMELGHRRGRMVLITDDALLRKFVARGYISRMVTTEAVTAHFDKFDPSIMTAEFNSSSLSGGLDPLEPLYAAIADLIVMARARCIMYSKGGFARLATWWSGTTCTKSAELCIPPPADGEVAASAGRRGMRLAQPKAKANSRQLMSQ